MGFNLSWLRAWDLNLLTPLCRQISDSFLRVLHSGLLLRCQRLREQDPNPNVHNVLSFELGYDQAVFRLWEVIIRPLQQHWRSCDEDHAIERLPGRQPSGSPAMVSASL